MDILLNSKMTLMLGKLELLSKVIAMHLFVP